MEPTFTHSAEKNGIIITGEVFPESIAKSDLTHIKARITLTNKDSGDLIQAFYIPEISEENMKLEVEHLTNNIDTILKHGNNKR
jgi:hypothetical protein